MKAAIMHSLAGTPQYADVPNPVVTNANEVLLTIRAAAIKNLDRSRAGGNHYSTEATATGSAVILGSDGVGVLNDGTRVYAVNPDGMVAEQAIVSKERLVAVPDGLDDATAAALPNAVMGAAMALRFRAGMQPGETVLINGATGVTGRVAIQIAKHYGAKKVIATGRNPASLQALLKLGADEIISLEQDDAALVAQLRTLHSQTPIDIIVDYLWGHPAEVLLAALTGKGDFTHPVRFVSVGSMAGDALSVSAAVLRSTNLYLSGSGLGSWTRQEVGTLLRDILPETFQLVANGNLHIETVSLPLHAIESMYDQPVPAGKRLVITMP